MDEDGNEISVGSTEVEGNGDLFIEVVDANEGGEGDGSVDDENVAEDVDRSSADVGDANEVLGSNAYEDRGADEDLKADGDVDSTASDAVVVTDANNDDNAVTDAVAVDDNLAEAETVESVASDAVIDGVTDSDEVVGATTDAVEEINGDDGNGAALDGADVVVDN